MSLLTILADEKNVERIRCKFDSKTRRHKRRKVSFSFNECLDLFKSDRDFSEIAGILGITHQGVSVLYRDTFEPIFGVTGVERRKKRTKATRQEPLLQDLAQLVGEQAKRHGCTPSPVPAVGVAKGRQCAYTKQISICGKLCYIGEATRLFHRRYLRVVVTPAIFAHAFALIVILRIEGKDDRFFVFPHTLFVELFGAEADWTVPQRTFNVPIRSSYRGKVGYLREYEDRWEIFKSA